MVYLKSFLPKKPTDVELKVISEMFAASVDGEAYDMDRWGQYFKPDGMRGNYTPSGNTPAVAAPTPKAVTPASTPVEDDDIPFESAAPAPAAAPAANGDAGSRAADIIAMIRNRQAK